MMATKPTEARAAVNGVELAYFTWPGDGPTVLMAHATGFHARVWDQVVNRLPGRRVISVDLRGHGRSEKPDAPYSWRTFGEDLAAFIETLQLTRLVGVGHSMGGHSIALAAGLRPEAFAALVLIEPTLGAEASYGQPRAGGMDHIRRRRALWRSPQEMFDRFQGRAPFASWDEAVLHDYCHYGLLPAEGDGFLLACPPEVEAAIYEGNDAASNIYPEVSRITAPVRVLLARELDAAHSGPFEASVTHADFFRYVPHAESFRFSQHSHFLVMEAPALVAGHIDEVARGVSA